MQLSKIISKFVVQSSDCRHIISESVSLTLTWNLVNFTTPRIDATLFIALVYHLSNIPFGVEYRLLVLGHTRASGRRNEQLHTFFIL